MFKSYQWRIMLSVAVLSLSIGPVAAGSSDDRVPITDPDMLQRFGYAPDARNIYATRQAMDELTNESATAANREASELEAASPRGTMIQPVSIHATDFMPVRVTSTTSFGSSGNEERWCDGGPSNVYMGIFQGIPDGATLRFRRIWHYDNSAEDLSAALLRICVPFDGPGEAETTILATNSTSGTNGYGRLGPGNFLGETVDRQSCSYGMRVSLGDANSCAGNQLRIMKASLSMDVPTSAVFADRFEQAP